MREIDQNEMTEVNGGWIGLVIKAVIRKVGTKNASTGLLAYEAGSLPGAGGPPSE